MSSALLVEVSLNALLWATLLYIPWILFMRLVAIRQARGALPSETARALLTKLTGGLLILGCLNVVAAVPFMHPDIDMSGPLVAEHVLIGVVAAALALALPKTI